MLFEYILKRDTTRNFIPGARRRFMIINISFEYRIEKIKIDCNGQAIIDFSATILPMASNISFAH